MPSRFDLHSVRNQTRKDDGLKRISVDKLRERLRYLTFEQLQLRPEVIKAIESIGPTKPSGIQVRMMKIIIIDNTIL